jgi:hypothetical protein
MREPEEEKFGKKGATICSDIKYLGCLDGVDKIRR